MSFLIFNLDSSILILCVLLKILDYALIWLYFVIMLKETKRNKKTDLKKEHFEILLEEMDHQFKLVTEKVSTLDNKIDTKIDNLSNQLHETREELIFLIKATVDHSESRLTKKIEDGDIAVMAYTDKKINEVMAYTDKKTDEVMAYTDKKTDEVMAYTDQKTNEVMAYTDKKTDEVMAYTDKKTNEVMAYTDKKTSEVMAYTDKKTKEVIDHTDQKIDEVKDILKTHANRLDEHDERFLKPERKH